MPNIVVLGFVIPYTSACQVARPADLILVLESLA